MPTTLLDNETLEDARRRRFQEEARIEAESEHAAYERERPSTTTDPVKLLADLRSRINPIYAAQIGTESYERRLCAEAIEGLLAQRNEERKKHEACVTINERLLSDNRILTAQRDELLAALGRVLRCDIAEVRTIPESCGAIEAARALLAKHTTPAEDDIERARRQV